MLDKNGLKEVLKTAVQSGKFPASGAALSSAIKSYVMANGTPKSPTISYDLSPASGATWGELITKASSSGVAEYIISDAISPDFAGSTKVIPAPDGVQTVSMSFNLGAQVKNLKDVKDFDEVWERISEAIIEFFKPEIE